VTDWFRLFRRKGDGAFPKPYLPDDDPLTLAVNRAFNTGETVYWTKGKPLPDPEGPVRKLPNMDAP